MGRTNSEQLRPGVFRDQLATVADIERLKMELILELKTLLAAVSPNQKKWLKSNEVKKLLGISTGTLQNLRINGSLSFSKVGGIIYYNHEDIVKLLKDNEQR